MDKEEEEISKRARIDKIEDGTIIVKNYDDMLHLLDEGWEVEEEINAPIFIMTKIKPEEPSQNLKRPLSPS